MQNRPTVRNQIIQAVGEQVWPPALQAVLAHSSLTLDAVRASVKSDLASLTQITKCAET